MSAPSEIRTMDGHSSFVDQCAHAREEAFNLLGTAAHYADLAQGHLQISDDAGALWDLTLFREYAIKALQAFKPIQETMKRGRDTRLEAAQ